MPSPLFSCVPTYYFAVTALVFASKFDITLFSCYQILQIHTNPRAVLRSFCGARRHHSMKTAAVTALDDLRGSKHWLQCRYLPCHVGITNLENSLDDLLETRFSRILQQRIADRTRSLHGMSCCYGAAGRLWFRTLISLLERCLSYEIQSRLRS